MNMILQPQDWTRSYKTCCYFDTSVAEVLSAWRIDHHRRTSARLPHTSHSTRSLIHFIKTSKDLGAPNPLQHVPDFHIPNSSTYSVTSIHPRRALTFNPTPIPPHRTQPRPNLMQEHGNDNDDQDLSMHRNNLVSRNLRSVLRSVPSIV